MSLLDTLRQKASELREREAPKARSSLMSYEQKVEMMNRLEMNRRESLRQAAMLKQRMQASQQAAMEVLKQQMGQTSAQQQMGQPTAQQQQPQMGQPPAQSPQMAQQAPQRPPGLLGMG